MPASFNRQERPRAYGHRFTAGRVGNLRRHWGIPCFEPTTCAPEGELPTIKKAAVVLGVAPSTIYRLLNEGIIAGEQPTPGAPWCIRFTKDLKDRFNDDAGEDFLPMREAMRALGASRQIVLQRVKHGELAAVHFMRGKQKGLRIKVIGQQPDLFDPLELSDVEATLARLLKTTTDHDRHPLSPRIMPEPGPPATLGTRLGSGPSDRMAAEGHSREDPTEAALRLREKAPRVKLCRIN